MRRFKREDTKMIKRSVFILAVLVTLLSSLRLAPRPFSGAAQPSTTGDPDGPGAFSDWGAPINIDNLGSTVNSLVIDQHPALSRKGLSLYFVSDRTPGVGGLDIWVCQRASANDPWGPPQNLGPGVNSSSTENAPTLSPDEHLLFFVSNRPGVFEAMTYGFLGVKTDVTISAGDRQ